METRIIAVLNQKGGVGKTTTCVNLGAALARRGRRVLLIDMDPQANLTVHLGIDPSRLGGSTYSVLLGQDSLAMAVLETATPGLLVVPSTLALANAEIQLASAVGRELILREAVEEWLWPSSSIAGGARPEPRVDFVLIDCPPSLGILSMNALCSAGEVLLPIQTQFFALQGVAGILECLRAVRRLNRDLRLSLVLPSMIDLRTTLAREVVHEIREYFGDKVARRGIRTNVRLAEAPSHGKTIYEYAPHCHGADDYDALAAEVLGEPEPESAPVGNDTSEEFGFDSTVSEAASARDESLDVFAADETPDPALDDEPVPSGGGNGTASLDDVSTTTEPLPFESRADEPLPAPRPALGDVAGGTGPSTTTP